MTLFALIKRGRHALFSALIATNLAGMSAVVQAGPKIEHWTLESGTRVYFVESRSLPLLDVQIDFAVGSAHEPQDKAGLAGLTRSLLDIGTEGMNEQEISEAIADTGAQFGGGSDKDRTSLSVRTLSSAAERDAAIALAARLLAAPTFPADAVERERARSMASLREALTRPATLASQRFNLAIYGDHPYSRTATIESLQGISRTDLVDFHREHFSAGNATVTVVGDASRDDANAIARALTQALPAGQPLALLAAPELPARSTERIPHPSAQAHISIGMPVLSRSDPDYYPLLVGNYVLGGGGFVSRLTREVRELRGFAYSVHSSFQPMQVAGPFQIGLQTRGSQADAALAVVDEVVRGFIAEGPTETELSAARDNFINGFGLRLDSNRNILEYVAMIGFYRLPLDWLDAYTGHIAKVTAEQVRDAFARRVKPEHLVTVIAGGDGDSVPTAAGTPN